MKRLSGYLVCGTAALSFVAAVVAGAPLQGGPFMLTIQAPKQSLRAGQPLTLRVTVKNVSQRPVHVFVSQGSYDVEKIYRLHVLDERGWRPQRAPLPKPSGGKGSVVIVGSVHGTRLKPGDSLIDEVNISHVYDLRRPGKYTIWIAEPFYRGPDIPNGIVKSNTITLTVVK